jgi:hypothetical protein
MTVFPPFTQWPFRCCQSSQICTAFAEIFLCLHAADQLKVEPTGQVAFYFSIIHVPIIVLTPLKFSKNPVSNPDFLRSHHSIAVLTRSGDENAGCI